jgi:hypothetical protein
MDISKLLRRVRAHDIALKSSFLCSKNRRTLIKHTKRCVIGGPDEEEKKSISHKLGGFEHGLWQENESLITQNLTQRVLDLKPGCMCHVINIYDNQYLGMDRLADKMSNRVLKNVFKMLKSYRSSKRQNQSATTVVGTNAKF